MKPKMLMALADACGSPHRGLVKEGARWILPLANATPHSGATIRALVDRGYLALYVGGTVAHATAWGKARFDEIRAAQRGRA